MIAMAMIALFAAAAPAQEGFEDLDTQQVEAVLNEQAETEELVLSGEEEECEGQVVFGDEVEEASPEDLVTCEDEE